MKIYEEKKMIKIPPFVKMLLLSILAVLTQTTSVVHGESLDIIGRVEMVTILPENISVKAKVDTGAKNSSLHCECTNTFRKNDEEWVSFTLTNYKGEKTVISRKIERMSTIKRHFGKQQERYVIKLTLCLGGKSREVEVNLVNREGFNYQMLLGRTYLEGLFLIDPAETFIGKPKCDQKNQ